MRLGGFMENKDLNKTIRCNSCNAEVPDGTKFCTECGEVIENFSVTAENESDQNIICPKCYVEVSPGLKFCEECGTKIETNHTSNQETTCPKCYVEVPPGLKFCEECGTKIESPVNHTTCPKCYEEVAAGETFCTKCGTSLKMKKSSSNANINQELKKQRESNGRNIPPADETLDSVVKTGKGLMKGLGGFLDKAASGIDKNLQSNKSGPSSNKNINERLQKRRTKEKLIPGFLVCDVCGGYYELQPDEAPDDFSDECECGGKLEHKSKL